MNRECETTPVETPRKKQKTSELREGRTETKKMEGKFIGRNIRQNELRKRMRETKKMGVKPQKGKFIRRDIRQNELRK